jgi:hypothetical protein
MTKNLFALLLVPMALVGLACSSSQSAVTPSTTAPSVWADVADWRQVQVKDTTTCVNQRKFFVGTLGGDSNFVETPDGEMLQWQFDYTRDYVMYEYERLGCLL